MTLNPRAAYLSATAGQPVNLEDVEPGYRELINVVISANGNMPAAVERWSAASPENAAVVALLHKIDPEDAEWAVPPAVRQVGVLMSDVVTEAVEFVWAGRIPRRKITLLDGDPGLGKSVLTLDLAARITTGRPMPDGAPTLQGGVVILSAEDGYSDTIRPRLEAAGADLTRVLGIETVGEGDDERLPAIPDDLDEIERGAARVGAVLIIIDPLMAYLSGEVNSHRDQDVRRALAQVAQLAERTNAAVLIIRHLNKSQGGKAIYRGGGSIGIGGAARSVLLVAGDPDDPDDPPTRRILATVKGNLSQITPSMQYQIVRVENGTEYGIAGVDWQGVSEHSAAALLASHVEESQTPVLDGAKGVLAALLAGGPMDAKTANVTRKAHGITEKTWRNAREALDVVTTPIRTADGRGIENWTWSLPDLVAPPLSDSEGQLGQGQLGESPDSLATTDDAANAPEVGAPIPGTGHQGPESDDSCVYCGAPVERYSADDRALCEEHVEAEAAMQ